MGFFGGKNGFLGVETGLFGANIGRRHFFYHFLHFSLDFLNGLCYFTFDIGVDIKQ